MLEKIKLLKHWVSTQQVVAKFRNRNTDDLATLVNQLEIEAERALHQPLASDSLLLLEIKTLIEQYKVEEMPDWNVPYHYDAEGWAALKAFIRWLERTVVSAKTTKLPNGIDLQKLKKLRMYSGRYDISIRFILSKCCVFIKHNYSKLEAFSDDDINKAIDEAIEYLDRFDGKMNRKL